MNKNNIKKGLKNVKWHGRFEFIGNILVDCAHNPSGFKVLVKELKSLKIKKHLKISKKKFSVSQKSRSNFSGCYKKLILVIGILNDKDIKKIIKIIEPFADKIILTKAKTPRAEEPIIIKKFIKNKNKIRIIKNVKNAVKYAEKIAEKEDLILVTGSCFVVGEVMKK